MHIRSALAPACIIALGSIAPAMADAGLVREWGNHVEQYVTPEGRQSCRLDERVGSSRWFGFIASDARDGTLAVIYHERGARFNGAQVAFQVDDHAPIHADTHVASTPDAAVIAITDSEVVKLAGQLAFGRAIRVSTTQGWRNFAADGMFAGLLTMMNCKSYIVGFHEGQGH